jgi:hypothetical protein
VSDSFEDGGPAFPSTLTAYENENCETNRGMSLRDYFAAKSLAGLITATRPANEIEASLCVQRSYIIADGMLAARKGGAK